MPLENNIFEWNDNHGKVDNDHYTQLGVLFRETMSEQDRKNTVSNIINSMSAISGDKKNDLINRQLCHFFRIDIGLGMAVAKGLGITIDENIMKHLIK